MKKMSGTMTRLCLLHHYNPGMMLLFGIITHHASGIFVLNVTVPLRGSPIRANCTFPGIAENVDFIFNISATGTDMVRCYSALSSCVPPSYPTTEPVFYTFWRGSNSAWIDILSLDRIRDQSIWRCSLGNNTTLGNINLTVLTSPKGVKYVQPILPDRDLGRESVTLICETENCAYPAPQISWYYLNNQQEKVRYNVSDGGMVNNTSTCDQLEAIYTSTLHLTRGTTFQGNIDFKTKFACGVKHPALDVDILYSEFSNYVTFAVSVTEITLESSTAGTFVFYDGFSRNLKCTSSPSRPSPTIKWMLESQTESVTLTDNITNTDVTNADGLYIRTSEITLTLKKENRNCKIFCSGNIYGQQIAALSSKVTIYIWYMPNKPEVQEYGAYFPWLENQSGTLICNSSDYGNPISNVSWTSNRGITDAKGHLVIKGLAWSDHRNMVSCQLVNRYTIDKDVHAGSESINLNVEYSPRIQFNTTSPLTVNETQFLSVSCNATGNPNPNQIVWSVRLDADGSLLRFENISRNDNGTYMCNATANSAMYGTLRNQMEFNIIVQYAPVMNVTNVTSTLQDTTSLITCEAIGFPAVYTFHPWKHMWGETTIRSGLHGIPSGSTSTNQNILKLERLSLQDMGTYVCSAENRIKGINGEFIQTAAVELNILGVPAFLREGNKIFAGGIGLFINISIPFYSYSNLTSFMFKRNGTAVMNTSRINTHLRSTVIDYKLHDRNIQLRAQEACLYIQNLTREDFDDYTLILENPQGPAEFIVTLVPFGPPLMVLRFYLNRVGDQVELHFDPGFNGGRIQEFVIQYKFETSLEDWKNASILQETEIQYRLPNGTFVVNITKPPPGSYIYRMYSWNEIGRSPYSLEIRVIIPIDAPVMNVTNVTSTLQDMTSLITCEAIGFPAVYTHPWKHTWGETTVRSGLQGIPTGSTSTSQNILKLERLSLQDMGTYVCSAVNRIKGINGEFNQTAAVDLNILDVPEVPSYVMIIEITQTSVTVQWMAGNSGGPQQTFHVVASAGKLTHNVAVADPGYRQNGTAVVEGLQPGTKYSIYLVAINSVGSSNMTEAIIVTTLEVIAPDSSSTFSLPAVAGGIGAGVVVILMAIVALFLWRRYHHRSQHTDDTQRNQINTKSVRHDAASGQDYEGLHINNTEASAYLQLNDITLEENRYAKTRPPENDSYEKLHPYANTDIQMYSLLKIPKISKDSEKVYENT